jgi:hypothetical protein
VVILNISPDVRDLEASKINDIRTS